MSTSTDSDSDSTWLWHLRLCHMSERSLAELHKRNPYSGIKTCKFELCENCVFWEAVSCEVLYNSSSYQGDFRLHP